jgi:CHAD domain-containing protein
MRAGDEVIDATPRAGARAVALALLADGAVAADRFAAAADEEALHDFRVALRRLRSTLRACRPWLGESVGGRQEKKMKKLARATNAARDAEVQLAWLASKRDALSSRRHRVGLDLLVRRLEARRSGPDVRRLVARYRRTARRLRRRLAKDGRRAGAANAAPATGFGGVLATLIRDHLEELKERLAAVRGAWDQPGVHAARIAGKRLRYLLEPLRGNQHANAAEAVKHLKRLQDVLGDLHDRHVLAGELREALVDTAAEDARRLFAAVSEAGPRGAALRRALARSPRAGLLALTALVREGRDALFAALEREWRAGGFDDLAAEVQTVAGALEARADEKADRRPSSAAAPRPPARSIGRAARAPPPRAASGARPRRARASDRPGRPPGPSR